MVAIVFNLSSQEVEASRSLISEHSASKDKSETLVSKGDNII